MKTLENKKIEIPGIENYAGMVKSVANYVPPNTGVGPAEMRERLRLVDVAEKAGETIEFEDSDAETLKRIENTVKWNIVHPDIAKFSEDVQAL